LEYIEKPTHWNYKGEVDKWGDKYIDSPIVFIACFDLCINASCPKIDPKKKIEQIEFILV
jgi:hypothetical protein